MLPAHAGGAAGRERTWDGRFTAARPGPTTQDVRSNPPVFLRER
jgi:hypothetical protein